MKRRSPTNKKMTVATPRYSVTGALCPNTGFWAPANEPDAVRFFHERTPMPPYWDQCTYWMPVRGESGA